MRYRLRTLLIAITVVCVVLAAICGFWRFSQHVIYTVEREHFSRIIREGQLPDPHNSPARTFLTSDEIDALVRESQASK
jgi:hypothetical protein